MTEVVGAARHGHITERESTETVNTSPVVPRGKQMQNTTARACEELLPGMKTRKANKLPANAKGVDLESSYVSLRVSPQPVICVAVLIVLMY